MQSSASSTWITNIAVLGDSGTSLAFSFFLLVAAVLVAWQLNAYDTAIGENSGRPFSTYESLGSHSHSPQRLGSTPSDLSSVVAVVHRHARNAGRARARRCDLRPGADRRRSVRAVGRGKCRARARAAAQGPGTTAARHPVSHHGPFRHFSAGHY